MFSMRIRCQKDVQKCLASLHSNTVQHVCLSAACLHILDNLVQQPLRKQRNVRTTMVAA